MADNSRNAKLGSKEEGIYDNTYKVKLISCGAVVNLLYKIILFCHNTESVFSWKLFSGWDFMIGHSETAANRIASVVMGFKEALLEEAEKQKEKKK